MKIVRFKAAGKTRYGAIAGAQIVEYAGTPFDAFRRGRKRYALKQVVILTPVSPSKIITVGVNYREREEELGRAPHGDLSIALKPFSALCGPDDPIILPPQSERVDFEGELAIVIRKRARHVPSERAREYILGYTCLNDVTARDLQARGQTTRAKAFDTFCPIGPCIATDIDPAATEIETYLNGERRQACNTKELVLPVEDIVARVSAVMTLLPGDVVGTGTPGGAGPMRPGDRVEVRIDGIGSLTNPVIKL